MAAHRYCAQRDLTPWLAVLGVLTIPEHAQLRSAVRESWLSEDPSAVQMQVRFVARAPSSEASINVPVLAGDLDEEARANRDMVFVRAPANMSRALGPLVSWQLWLDCALEAWPYTRNIGKADDDVWLHLPQVAMHLHASQAWLERRHPEHEQPLMYWGIMERFHLNLTTGLPIGFGYKFGSDCRQRPATMWDDQALAGPFPFAKGPCFFASTPLVAQIAASTELQALVDSVATTRLRDHEEHPTWPLGRLAGGKIPWEDVFMGFALAQVRAQYAIRMCTRKGTKGSVHVRPA